MTLWTPDGERPVGRSEEPEPQAPVSLDDLSPEERAQVEAMQAQLDEVRRELLGAPASVVVANHAMGIYELAAIHLTAPEPKLTEAVLAIDALAALVEGLAGRLGDGEATLQEALTQLRTAYLEVAKEHAAEAAMEPDPELLQALLADADELAGVLDARSGALYYLNAAGRRILALTAATPLEGLTLEQLVAGVDRPTLELELWPALLSRGKWTGTLHLVTAVGTEIPTRTTVRIAGGSITWVAHDISTERAVYQRLHQKVFEDEVTGLPHRSIFLDRLDLSLRRSDPGAPPITLLFVSLDRFRERSERLRTDERRTLLQAVAQRLDGRRATSDSLSRWGDEEFVVLAEDEAVPGDSATWILGAFSTSFHVGAEEIFLTASVGTTSGRPGEVTTDQLLREADAASQMARRDGGGTVAHFDEGMQARAWRRAEVESALLGAAARGELVLHYQPEVSLRTNKIVAVEALVRWQHPTWGLVAPAEFVPVAEGSVLILEVGAWVLHTATVQAARWREDLGAAAPVVSVNISARQFSQDDFVEVVAGALERSGAAGSDLCLEITESVLMDDVEITHPTLTRLKALGVQLAVDDFGTGYSSLSYLRRFPVDVLKVDQSFVRGLGHDAEDSAIVRAVVHMGRALWLTTVAEGVETAHQMIELRELDCDLAQGYHFARPQPAEAVTRMLAAGPDWMQATV